MLAEIEARIARRPGGAAADARPGARPLPAGRGHRHDRRRPELHVLARRQQAGRGLPRRSRAFDDRRRPARPGRSRLHVPTRRRTAPRPAGRLTRHRQPALARRDRQLHPATRTSTSNIWFARDVPPMAEELGTEPVLVVARAASTAADGAIAPLPVDTARHPERPPAIRDHLVLAGRRLVGMTGLSAVAYPAADAAGRTTQMRYISTRGRPRS